MPKKTTILILLLAAVTAILVFFAISAETGTQKPPSDIVTSNNQAEVEKTTSIYFNPKNIEIPTGSGPQSVDIMVNTNNSDISGVQLELEYDPLALVNVRLEPETNTEGLFGSAAIVLFNDINSEAGRASYAVTIGPSQESKKGNGKIATLFFEPSTVSTSTVINFSNKTLVTMLGENESVLKDTTPLNISITGTNTAPQQTQQIFQQTPEATLAQ